MYAGILPYFIDDEGVVWLLLGQERKSEWPDSLKWGGFGGLVEENETFIDAAAREGYEESMGILGDVQQLRSYLSENMAYPMRSRHVRHYLIRLSEKDQSLPDHFDRMYRYAQWSAKISGQELPGLNKGAWEKCRIAWIPLDAARQMPKEMRPSFLKDIKKMRNSLFI